MNITVQRQQLVGIALFGRLTAPFDASFTSCVSLENDTVKIPAGIYDVTWYDSPHWHVEYPDGVPLIHVPGRDYIEMHPANWARQLKGCVAMGEEQSTMTDPITGLDEPAVTKSDAAYARFRALTQLQPFTLEIIDP